jgi:hypothetical protein
MKSDKTLGVVRIANPKGSRILGLFDLAEDLNSR